MGKKILLFCCMLLAGVMFTAGTYTAKANETEAATSAAVEVLENEEVEKISEEAVSGSAVEAVTTEETDVTATAEEEEAEAVEEKPKKVKKTKKTVKEKKLIYNATDEELKMLACVIFLEAGNQSYEGKLAVGNVVLNRVLSNKFPNTIKSVIYQKVVSRGVTYYQFSLCKPGGRLDQAMKVFGKRTGWAKTAEEEAVKAAKAALEGKEALAKKYHFFMVYNSSIKARKPDGVKLGDHYFYNY